MPGGSAELLDAIAASSPHGPAAQTHLASMSAWWHNDGGQPSRLTPSGAPLEFTLRSGSSDIAYTLDPADPGQRLADTLVSGLCRSGLRAALAGASDRRFGWWAGFRHGEQAMAAKFYAEASPSAAGTVLAHLAARMPGCDMAGMVPLLVAWKPGREDACEVYCRIGSPTPRVLHRLFAGASSAGHLPIAADCLAFLARVPADGLWPRFRLGVSFAFTADGVTLTLFAHANQIFPSAATAHRRIAELGRQLAAPLPVYEAISRRIALERLAEVAHGMVGMKMLGDGRIALAVGVSAGDLTRTR